MLENNNNGYNKNTSVVKELKLKLSLIVLGLLVSCLAIFGYESYRQSMSLALDDVKRHSSTIALNLQNEVGKHVYGFTSLADNRVLAELPFNLLYTQYAFRELKRLVNENELIDAAIISDGSEYFVEAYPLEALKYSSPTLNRHTNRIMQVTNKEFQINLVHTKESINGLHTDVNGSLFFSIALRKSNSSLINPYETTGVLYLLLNPKYLLSKDNAEEYSRINMLVDGESWYSHGTDDVDSNLSYTQRVFGSAQDGVNLDITVQHNESFYTNKVTYSILFSAVVILITFGLLILFLMRLAKRIHSPIAELSLLAKSFENGNYQQAKKSSEFQEFDQLFCTMDHLANTIQNQLEDLAQQKDIAEESERVKANFLANMSHEIRTPMNGILGTMQILQRQNLPSDALRLIEKGVLSSKMLLTIVNDILDFSKIEAGRLTLENIPINITRILESTITDLQREADSKGITINHEVVSEYEEGWHGDPIRIKQIILNLLSNAVKFTDKGSVVVRLESNSEGLLIHVQDTGIGMSENMVKGLFNRFEQADKSTTRRYGGTGLGMAITHQLVELMGGKIKVNSTLGEGTSFEVFLPLLPVPIESVTSEQLDVINTPNLAGKTILLAEDNKINQTVFLAMMRPTRANIVVADDGLIAIEKFKEIHPDLVFMDIQMPVMDGVESCLKIKAIDDSVPVIALTANVMKEDVVKYLETGFVAHIGKPIEMDELYKELTHYLRH